MGVSLSVFKIKDYKKEKLTGNGEISTLTGQLTFKDLELMDELGSAKSTEKYSDWKRALSVMLKETNFQMAVPKGQRRL